MPKLPRVFQNQFGLNGDQAHFGQFGSRVATPPGFTTKDPATIQALSAFTANGWLDAINSGNLAPFLEDMNGLMYLLFYQFCYLFEEGIAEWNGATTYWIGSTVRKPGTTEQYGSLVDSNTGNALPSQTDNAFWHYLNPTATAPGIMSDYGGPTAPFGWLLCDGTSYPTATYPNLFTAIGYTWGGSGANFNVPNMAGRASIGAGTGSGGLTPRTLAQILGEETHTLVLSEIPSHNHGVTDPGHHHVWPSAINLAGSNNARGFGSGLTDALVNSSTTGITIQFNGGGGSHNNMQPSAVVNKIIKI